MAQIRRQFSIGRLLAAVLVVAFAFAWPVPWQIALTLSVGMLIPVFVSGLSWVEILVILANAALIGALLIPAVSSHCRSEGTGVPSSKAKAPSFTVTVPLAPLSRGR